MNVERRTGHDLPLLDGLRAFAALLIVATHVGFQTGATARGPWGGVVARFDLGVSLFFALSGFLLVRPWLAAAAEGRPSPSTRRYVLHRIARIAPAYWVVLVVALLTTARGSSTEAVGRNAALVQTYRGPLLPGLTQTWSLCTEVAFYLVLPFVAPLLATASRTASGRRGCGAGLALACVVAWTWTALAAGSHVPPLAGTWLPGHLDWFAVGLALAMAEADTHARPAGVIARARREVAARPGSVLLLAGALFWVACTSLAGPRSLAASAPGTAAVKEALYACLAGLVLLAVGAVDQRSGPVAAVLGNRGVRWVGRISYGIFLWHLLVLAAVLSLIDRAAFTGGFWPVLVLTVAGTLAVAELSWTLLEAPMIRGVHRPMSRQPAARR